MTSSNFKKTAVRARMVATGEPYSVAARALASAPLTSFPSLDKALAGGFSRSQLHLIGAAAGVGRYTLGLNLAIQMSRSHQSLAYISLEAPKKSVESALTQIEEELGSPAGSLTKRITVQEELLSLESIEAWLRQNTSVSAVILDHLHLLESPAHMSSIEWQATVAQRLQSLASETGTAIILMAQLSRLSPGETDETRHLHRALLSTDLLAVAATVIYLARPEPSHRLQLRILKSRWSPLQTLELQWPAAGCRALGDGDGLTTV